MLAGLKQLPLVSKIIFIISLVVLFAWVIPTMVYYFKSVQAQNQQVAELQGKFSKYGLSLKHTKKFSKESFIADALKSFSNATVEPLSDGEYILKLEMDKDKISDFNTFLETLSLRYLVKVVGPITFKEKDKHIEVEMTIQEI
jgi:archaellum component FlaF (FlaF/FlaG flagellin family)